MRRLTLALAAFLVLASPAGAAVDPETQADFARAAAYWNASPSCVAGVDLVVDQAFVAPNAARAEMPGCRIYVGDYYFSASPGKRCGIITHEWGHLLGHNHVAGLPDDPLGVMVSDSMPQSCLALDGKDAATIARTAAAWTTAQAAFSKWAQRTRDRTECTADANELPTRARRIAARARCVKRIGHIGKKPEFPASLGEPGGL